MGGSVVSIHAGERERAMPAMPMQRRSAKRARRCGVGTSRNMTELSLGIDALSAAAMLAPGAPLCRAHAETPGRDGLELALKGGQIGADDYFSAARHTERKDAI